MSYDPISAVLDISGKLIDRIWPDPVKAAEAKLALTTMLEKGELDKILGQLEINKIEAAHSSLFVSGWRPAVGWICTAGLGMQFLVAPMITWFALIFGKVLVLPPLDLSVLVTMLSGILGLGTLRTVEKIKEVASK